ncbi:MAG: Asp-tRNA(Asn)/Glu-tRNA(Gln) amidotransferase subunit GatC [Candidatus Dormibacteraeota bacterium]|nr:Asp-tRNA(Asn)/Glu-tRNA(Gln) amidotransferase subunit GatC [Candidatus Dormibacteraeota bacterium]
MKLSVEQVRHVAELARLGLTDAEMERLTGELSKILDYIDQLEELDTSSVEPTAQVGGLTDVFREDEARESLPVEAALSNAPAAHDGYFRVRAMQE